MIHPQRAKVKAVGLQTEAVVVTAETLQCLARNPWAVDGCWTFLLFDLTISTIWGFPKSWGYSQTDDLQWKIRLKLEN